jgi:hypothetical protein
MSLRALGGGELVGTGPMRSAYLDEAGIANPQQEPFVVVAGVILHIDKQWRALHAHFDKLIEKFVPEHQRDGFIFHAQEIWHGTKTFDRKTYQGDRKEVLKALCQTITEFQLPIVFGIADRRAIAKFVKDEPGGKDPKTHTFTGFMAAFGEAAIRSDVWMRLYADPSECLSLVMENNNELKKYAKAVFRELRRKTPHPVLAKVRQLPITRIVDAPSFMDKSEAPPLQLADLCAFILKRWVMGKADIHPYLDIISVSLLSVFGNAAMRDILGGTLKIEPE